MSISRKTAIEVWTKAGGMCAFPNCRQDLARESSVLVGQLAHIVGRSQAGPRGEAKTPDELRDLPDNLVLLCYPHHREVDTNVAEWPGDRLREVKVEHESWVRQRLSDGDRWYNNIDQLEYINVPRILMLSEFRGNAADIRPFGMVQSLTDLSPLVSVMRTFKSAIESIDLHATPLRSVRRFDDSAIGALVSFRENFRTKNYGKFRDDALSAPIGDLARGPQIYLKLDDWRFVMLIDPSWITTATAHADFEAGQHRFAGIAMIKNVDQKNRRVLATPYFLGVDSGLSQWPRTP
jgi:hypothetical protein